MKKRITSSLLALGLILGVFQPVLAKDYSPNIIINNENLELEEIHKNEKEQLMFPIRIITEKLDYSVKWDNNDKSVELSKNDDIIKLKINQTKINVKGKQIELKSSPIVRNGKTLIPIEFFEKALKLKLGWDSEKRVLKINNPKEVSEKFFELSEDELVRKNIDSYMITLTDYNKFQGSLLVARDDKLLISKGYGLANIDQKVKNQSQTKFAIGSITKQFTAMAIMQLCEKGLINVDDKVDKYIPGLLEGKNIRIENLLVHTSGLVNYTDLSEFLQSDFDNKDPMKMVDLIKDRELEFEPGEIFKYRNTNYLLLGMIVEQITGQSLEDYLQTNILKPLNMESTGVSYGKDQVSLDASPYTGFIEVQEINDKAILSQAYGAGNMYSTVEDLYRWDRALKTEKLVKQETLNEIFKKRITTSEDDGYGYGWMIGDTDDGRWVGHGGNTFGFTSNLDRYVDKDLTIIALSNKGYVDIASISEDVKNISLKKPYKEPEKLEEIEIENKDIYKKYTGTYDFINGTYLVISEDEGRLFAQATGQGAFEIFPQSKNRFFAKIADIKIEFADGQKESPQLTLEQLGQKFECKRTAENEEEVKPLEPVKVDTKIYKDYVGKYELGPGAIVTISNEDERIYAKLTGQEKYEIFPLSESEYFYKAVDAKITFERDEEGLVTGLIFDQNVMKIPASKI